MSIKNIVLLGDSTSMSIGCYQNTFAYYLTQKKIWSNNSRLYNCSVHGFSSADALKFIKSKKINNVDCILINLGICDSISTNNLKRRYNFFSNFRKRKKEFNNIHFYNWNKNFSNIYSLTESDIDFEYNIDSIIKVSKKISNKIIIIIPSSNELFHPGLAKGNFSYYFYFDLFEKSSEKLNFEISDLKLAMKYKEDRKYSESNKIYYKILKNNTNIDSELSFMIANNYAVNLAHEGEFTKSIESLKILLDEDNLRKEIIFYNIAKIYKKIGKHELYKTFINKSYEADISNYRIKNSFRNILINLANRHKIEMLDVNNLKNKSFYDHCHLTSKAHFELSENIVSKMKLDFDNSCKSASIENILLNPEFAYGNNKNFNDYFDIIPKNKIDFQNEIKNVSLTLDSNGNQRLDIIEGVNDNFYESVKFYLSHPFFSDLALIKKVGEFHPFFYGKFPEFFLISLVQFAFNSLKENYLDPKSVDEELFLSKSNRNSIFENLGLNIDLDKKINFSDMDLFLFLETIKQKLMNIVYQYPKNNLAHERRKYTMYWFFRESVRFGTHSRISMFYNLIELQNLYESTILCIGLKKLCGYQDDNFFEKMKLIIENIKKINDNYIKDNLSKLLDFSEDFDSKDYHLEIENCIKII